MELLNMTIDNITNHTLVSSAERPYASPLQLAVMWLLIALILVMNSLVFAAMPKFQTLQPGTWMSILSLSIADVGLALFLMIFLLYNLGSTGFQVRTSDAMCIVQGFSLSLFASTSLWTLTYMNIDRLLTMAFPLRYPIFMTRRKTATALVVIWALMFSRLIPKFVNVSDIQVTYYEHAFVCIVNWTGGLGYNLMLLIALQLIPLILIVISFLGILIIAIRRRVKAGQATSQLKRNLRIFRTLAIMTFGFYIAWVPYSATITFPELSRGKSLSPLTDFIAIWVVASNSFWNPIIYMLTMPSFLKALRDVSSGLKMSFKSSDTYAGIPPKV